MSLVSVHLDHPDQQSRRPHYAAPGEVSQTGDDDDDEDDDDDQDILSFPPASGSVSPARLRVLDNSLRRPLPRVHPDGGQPRLQADAEGPASGRQKQQH